MAGFMVEQNRSTYAGRGIVCVSCCAKAGIKTTYRGILYSRSVGCRVERIESRGTAAAVQV